MPRSSRPAPQVLQVATPVGAARATVTGGGEGTAGTLVLGHGAGGGIGAPDLVRAEAVATSLGWRVALVEQPWRVAGGRVAPAPPRLDAGWLAVLGALRDGGLGGGPLVVGGRSAGARVGCRTATSTGAAAVLCLAFPLHPPGRPERSRAGELVGAGVPVHVVQGRRDPFGSPDEVAAAGAGGVVVHPVAGDHGLKASSGPDGAVAAAVRVALLDVLARVTE